SSIIYSVPAFVIPQEGSSNNFVTTPIIEKVSQNMTLLIDHSTTVQSRIARVEQVSMQFNGTGNNVGFSFGITDSPPAGTPIPPFDASALFLNVDYVGTDSLGNKLNFSDPSMFASSPQERYLSIKTWTSQNCPTDVLTSSCYYLMKLLDHGKKQTSQSEIVQWIQLP